MNYEAMGKTIYARPFQSRSYTESLPQMIPIVKKYTAPEYIVQPISVSETRKKEPDVELYAESLNELTRKFMPVSNYWLWKVYRRVRNYVSADIKPAIDRAYQIARKEYTAGIPENQWDELIALY